MDLIADIGATNSRCALVDERGDVQLPEVFANEHFAGIEEMLAAYLDRRRATDKPRRAALAVAAPVLGDRVEMINIGWKFSQEALAQRFGLGDLKVLNDFAALAFALPKLGAEERAQIGPGVPLPGKPLAVLGPGTGLGVATLVPAADGWTVVSGEGGHVTLPAQTAAEAEVVEHIRDELGHCSAERALSGPGLKRLYDALAQLEGRATAELEPEQITSLAREGDALAAKALGMFFCFLGTVASNLALTVGAHGGVFVGGGIVPQLLEEARASGFRERFTCKGRYREYLDAIPTYVITEPLPAFRGLQTLLGYA